VPIEEEEEHDIKVNVWYTVGANMIIGSIFFSDTVSSHQNFTQILTPFFERVGNMGRWLEGNI
jgi:hypothetical protein